MMTLTRERVLEVLDYRPETGEFFWKKAKRGLAAGARAGTLNAQGYRVISINSVLYYAHRLVWLIETGELPERVDHRDTCPDNCAFSNLRPCSKSQNGANRGKPNIVTTSRFKGVTFRARTGRWLAQTRVLGKYKFIGSFADEIDAARAYNAAAIKHFGEFACLNEIPT